MVDDPSVLDPNVVSTFVPEVLMLSRVDAIPGSDRAPLVREADISPTGKDENELWLEPDGSGVVDSEDMLIDESVVVTAPAQDEEERVVLASGLLIRDDKRLENSFDVSILDRDEVSVVCVVLVSSMSGEGVVKVVEFETATPVVMADREPAGEVQSGVLMADGDVTVVVACVADVVVVSRVALADDRVVNS